MSLLTLSAAVQATTLAAPPVTQGSPLHLLGIGLIVAGLLLACIAGFQLLMFGIDTVRGVTELPGRLLYVGTGIGLLIFLVGLWLLNAPT